MARPFEVGVEWAPACNEYPPLIDCEREPRGTGDEPDDSGESPIPELTVDWRTLRCCWLLPEFGINLESAV